MTSTKKEPIKKMATPPPVNCATLNVNNMIDCELYFYVYAKEISTSIVDTSVYFFHGGNYNSPNFKSLHITPTKFLGPFEITGVDMELPWAFTTIYIPANTGHIKHSNTGNGACCAAVWSHWFGCDISLNMKDASYMSSCDNQLPIGLHCIPQ